MTYIRNVVVIKSIKAYQYIVGFSYKIMIGFFSY